jgi:hypothetical protein
MNKYIDSKNFLKNRILKMDENKKTSNILKRIRRNIYGTLKKDKIDQIDGMIDNISNRLNDKDIFNQVELVRKTIGNNIGEDIVDNNSVPILTSKDLLSRIDRYNNADECVDKIPYCARALDVLTNSILAPDDIKKNCIQVFTNNDDQKNTVKDIKQIIKKLKIDNLINRTIKDTLKYGDQFIEICNYKSKDVPITKSLLNEENKINEDTEYGFIAESIYNENEKFERKITLEFVEEEDYDNKEELVNNLDNIKLIKHDADKIIKLQSKRYKLNLGYLILPDTVKTSAPTGSFTKTSFGSTALGLLGYEQSSGIDEIYEKIFSNIKKKLEKDEIKIDKKEVKDLLSRCIIELGLEDDKKKNINLKIRFVPEHKMEHFNLENDNYFPYGEGIFNKIIFQAKMFMALETSMTIKRLSEATEKRIIYVETGMSRDARNIVEQVRSEFNKRKFSIDKFGSISSIPSMVPNFQDIYIPQSKGKRFLEFDTLREETNARDSTEELKLYRDFLVSDLGIPPAYLNIEENMSNKNALAFENALFAETIVGYQFILNPNLDNLISKIYKLLKFKKMSSEIIITFPPPKMLQMERESERVDYGIRTIQNLKEIGIPIEWSKKQVFDYPWDEIEEFKSSEEMNKKMGNSPDENQEMMGNTSMY